MAVGLQGSGKTTFCGKLALQYKNKGKRVLLAACDTQRPAAREQLKVLRDSIGVKTHLAGEDAVTGALEARQKSLEDGADFLIVDTAGRLHIDEELMNELARMKAKLKPTEILLVLDAMTGQDAVNVAEQFHQKLGLDGLILTKLDGDARGGAALSVRKVTGVPVKLVGIGEKLTDLEPFHPDRVASRILGMGDIVGLVEKAQEAFSQKKSGRAGRAAAEKKLYAGGFPPAASGSEKNGPARFVGRQASGRLEPGNGGRCGRKRLETYRSHLIFHDPRGAGTAAPYRRLPPPPDCPGFGNDGAGSEPVVAAVRTGGQNDEIGVENG
jgi:signal recognition particle subunit SRP54